MLLTERSPCAYVKFSGDILADTFENMMTRFTDGSAQPCTTQQAGEQWDVSGKQANVADLIDPTRVASMRTASDLDRPASDQTAVDNLLNGQYAGYYATVTNIYLVGVQIVQGLLNGWNVEAQCRVLHVGTGSIAAHGCIARKASSVSQ
ncbi:unnamed protein product [Peniophora sp. CBMAI 1063]|nr:unnamed protein product [Peniophora sp. CBMAI 1063]